MAGMDSLNKYVTEHDQELTLILQSYGFTNLKGTTNLLKQIQPADLSHFAKNSKPKAGSPTSNPLLLQR